MKFNKGDEVTLTEEAKEKFPKSPINGVVACQPRQHKTVMVRSEGQLCPVSWSVDFWEHKGKNMAKDNVLACRLAQTQQTAAIIEIYNDGITALLSLVENDQDGWLLKQASVVAQIERDIEALSDAAKEIKRKSQVGFQAAYIQLQAEAAFLKLHNDPKEAGEEKHTL